MPKSLLDALLKRGQGSEEDDTEEGAALATGAELGARIATLTSENASLKSRAEAAEARQKETQETLDSSLGALKAEARLWAVAAYGQGTASLTAEEAIIDAATTPAQLSALLGRYRAATPERFRNADGQRQTEAQASEAPKEDADKKREEREALDKDASSVVDGAFGPKGGRKNG